MYRASTISGQESFKTNSLTNDRSLKWSKLKEFADGNSNVVGIARERVEKIVGKEENAGYQHLKLFPQCFPKSLSQRLLKNRIQW